MGRAIPFRLRAPIITPSEVVFGFALQAAMINAPGTETPQHQHNIFQFVLVVPKQPIKFVPIGPSPIIP